MEWWEGDGHWRYELVSKLDSGKGTPQCLQSRSSFNYFQMTDYKNPFLHLLLRLPSHQPKILHIRGHTLTDDFPLYASHPDSSELFQGAAGGEKERLWQCCRSFLVQLSAIANAWDQHQKEWQYLPVTKVLFYTLSLGTTYYECRVTLTHSTALWSLTSEYTYPT